MFNYSKCAVWKRCSPTPVCQPVLFVWYTWCMKYPIKKTTNLLNVCCSKLWKTVKNCVMMARSRAQGFCLRARRVGGEKLESQFHTIELLSIFGSGIRNIYQELPIRMDKRKQASIFCVRTACFIFIWIIFCCCWVVLVLSEVRDKGGRWHVVSQE